MISAILLAAGEAKRMGKPKQLMPLGGKSILEHSLDNLLGSRVNEVIVVVGCEAEAVMKKLAARPVRIAENRNYQQGMSTSLVKGLGLVSDRTEAVMVALADQPFIDSHVIDQLIDEFEKHKKGIAVPVYKGKRGHPIIFAIKYRSELLGLSGDTGGKEILERHPDDVLEVDTGSEDIHRDIDDMKSYERELRKSRKGEQIRNTNTETNRNNQETRYADSLRSYGIPKESRIGTITKQIAKKMPKTNSIKFEELDGKKLAIVVWGEDEEGKDDVAVFSGLARWNNGHLFLDRKGKPKSFQLPDHTLERIKPVPADIKNIVPGAEFYVNMSIGQIPDNANPKEYKNTGLKWPKKKDIGA